LKELNGKESGRRLYPLASKITASLCDLGVLRDLCVDLQMFKKDFSPKTTSTNANYTPSVPDAIGTDGIWRSTI
jgi:hypothetical protein